MQRQVPHPTHSHITLKLIHTPDKSPHHAAETWENHNWAVMETWIGCGAVASGSLTVAPMHKVVYGALEQQCRGNECKGAWVKIPTRIVVRAWLSVTVGGQKHADDAIVQDANLEIWAEGKWANDGIRKIMINTVAKTLEELTASTNENCYRALDTEYKYFCNTADMVRINLPPIANTPNYLWQGPRGDENAGSGGAAKDAFGREFTRDVRCLVTGLVTCEECGKKCDGCHTSPCA
ncbi:hypothetical protein FB567DRAFT_546296 [Paraphoma chrysanthemicola]|uniref:Uncharacterized protein n=1 Tax=Paraphoma chrysanthemicola TaxID=798071 RepID=A0A8K0RFG4_9PLEO|nr:hypothetical protein FB567DRAFT_546296 [Paraphoma chrysanthemicola]